MSEYRVQLPIRIYRKSIYMDGLFGELSEVVECVAYVDVLLILIKGNNPL